MGKYDKFKEILPTYKEALEEITKEYAHLTQTQLLEKFTELKNKREEIKDQLKEIEKEFTAVTELLVDRFEAESISHIKNSDLGSFNTRTSVFVNLTDKDKLHEWLRENNYGDVIKEGVHPKVLNSLFTDILESSSLPEDAGVQVFLKTGITHKSK